MKCFSLTALIASLASSALASGELTSIRDLEGGATVTIVGTVYRITDEDEFRLKDESGSVRVYVGPNWVPAAVGEVVTVNGLVDDGMASFEVYAHSMIRADGTFVEFLLRRDE